MPKNLTPFLLAGGITLFASVLPMAAQTDVYLFGGQSNMNPDIVDGFRARLATLDPDAVLWTPRYRNPGIGLDSGWGGNTWHGDPPAPGRTNFYGGTGPSDPNIGNAYSDMLGAWQNSISRIEGDYEIRGIIWVQGEQDAKEEISANRYATSLDNLIARIHEDLGLAQGSVQFFYTSMESNSGRFTYRATVRAQQLAADKDSGDPLSIANANRVDASGLAYKDNVHYTTASQTELGERIAQAIAPYIAPPAAPTALAATPADGQVSLNWDDHAQSGVTYSVYRTTTSGSYGTALASGLSNSETVDSTAVNGTTYYYVVTATNSNGESVTSNEVIGIPAAPDNLAPAFTSDPVLETNALEAMSYTASIADNASDPESDPMVFSLVSGPAWLNVDLDGSLSGTPGTEDVGINTFTVDVTAAGGSDTATLQITVDPDTTAPDAPTGLSATPGDASVSLDWADNDDSDLASYTVYRSTTSDDYGSALATGVSNSDYIDTTAANATTYYYVVTAVDNSSNSNESEQSSEISATPVDTAPAAPTGLIASGGDNTVILDWDENSESDVASYSVYRSETSDSYGSALATGLLESDYTDNTVTNDTTYYYVVTVTDNGSNESAQSDEASVTPKVPPSDYQNDFSTEIPITSIGGTSPWINNDIQMPTTGNHTFIGFSRDAVENNLDKTGGANSWLLINTETWPEGDYTVTFDGLVSSGTMNWDVIGGNASGSGTGLRIWMNKSHPYFRGLSAGTAHRLGQINAAGDTAGGPKDAVAAGSFTNTTMASQSLTITLTSAHVGSTNDYILIGWAGASGTIDNLSVTSASGDTYTAWISGFDVGGQTTFTDDVDKDGLSNGIESYFGTHPGAYNAGVIPSTVDSSAGTFTFSHPISDPPATDITAAYRWSKDLSAGFHADGATSDGTTVTFDQGTPSDGEVTVTAMIEGTPTERLFVDIEVMQN